MRDPALENRAIEYARLSSIALDLKRPLGHGNDGTVWASDKLSAVKALGTYQKYCVEKECYQRFAANKIRKIHEFAVPELLGWSDDLWIVEMRIVTPPFLLDFAKAWIDQPADYSPEAMDDWEDMGNNLFGKRWLIVKKLLRTLERYGIYYYDAKPGNITFGDEDDRDP